MGARFDAVNMVVSDMGASRQFYSLLGLEFANSHEPLWDRHHVTAVHPGGDDGPDLGFDLDSASFAHQWNAGWPGGAGVVLGFRVEAREEVDELVSMLAAGGATVQQAPYDAFWGARYGVVSDPDGNAVGIMSPVDPAFRSTAPSPQ
jgi:predicted lactoylglutathione lyase